jgi:hypothetical protein
MNAHLAPDPKAQNIITQCALDPDIALEIEDLFISG